MDGRNEHRVATKFCFKAGLSATETLVLVQKAYGNEALNLSNVFRWYSRFLDGREVVDKTDGRPKLTWTEVNIAAVVDLAKNDHRIASRMIAETLKFPKTVVLRIPKEQIERCLHVFSTLLDTWTKGRSSHILPRHYRDGRCRQHFFNKIITEMRPGVLPMTPKQKNRVLIWMVIHPLGRRKWNSKFPALRTRW